MKNYAALGEHTALTEQARDAALRRYALLSNLSHDLLRLADKPEQQPSAEDIDRAVDGILKADKQMRAAIDRANELAPLCDKLPVSVRSIGQVR